MRKFRRVAVAGLVVVALLGACRDDTQQPATGTVTTSTSAASGDARLTARAAAVTELIAQNDWPTLRKDFDANLAGSLSEAQLADAWKKMIDRFGAYKSFGAPTQHPSQGDGIETFDIPMTFERGAAKTRIAFAADGKIAGLFFLDPATP